MYPPKNKTGLFNSYQNQIFNTTARGAADLLLDKTIDQGYDSAFAVDSLENFQAICLSGIRTEDNDGNNVDANDSIISGSYQKIKIKPKNSLGMTIPDFTSISNPDQINFLISTLDDRFIAESDFAFDTGDSISFGQIIDCRKIFDSGDSYKIVFSRPSVVDHEPGYVELGLLEGIKTAADLFSNNPSLLGSMDSIDPRYPPREWTYVGANTNYYGQKLQNGNLPSDLMGKATKGGTFKPEMLAEMVPLYDQMCVDFRKAFPTKQLSAWGYRPYSRQLSIKVEKPNLAAKPGTSNHGWGQAIDIHYYEDGSSQFSKLLYTKPEYIWLKNNSKKYGWYNPAWASQGGSKEEPWHWEAAPSKFKRG